MRTNRRSNKLLQNEFSSLQQRQLLTAAPIACPLGDVASVESGGDDATALEQTDQLSEIDASEVDSEASSDASTDDVAASAEQSDSTQTDVFVSTDESDDSGSVESDTNSDVVTVGDSAGELEASAVGSDLEECPIPDGGLVSDLGEVPDGSAEDSVSVSSELIADDSSEGIDVDFGETDQLIDESTEAESEVALVSTEDGQSDSTDDSIVGDDVACIPASTLATASSGETDGSATDAFADDSGSLEQDDESTQLVSAEASTGEEVAAVDEVTANDISTEEVATTQEDASVSTSETVMNDDTSTTVGGDGQEESQEESQEELDSLAEAESEGSLGPETTQLVDTVASDAEDSGETVETESVSEGSESVAVDGSCIESDEIVEVVEAGAVDQQFEADQQLEAEPDDGSSESSVDEIQFVSTESSDDLGPNEEGSDLGMAEEEADLAAETEGSSGGDDLGSASDSAENLVGSDEQEFVPAQSAFDTVDNLDEMLVAEDVVSTTEMPVIEMVEKTEVVESESMNELDMEFLSSSQSTMTAQLIEATKDDADESNSENSLC
ncbi:MAG: hypothetical protein ACE361_17295 [Aureliella sp.]